MPVAITIEQLGEELRRRRVVGNLTLRDVESLTGISAATLSRIERGSKPDFETVGRLAKWLDVVVHTSGKSHPPKTDEDLKRSIEVHLRAEKKLPANLARSIAESFDLVMQVEMEKAARKKR